MTEKQMMEFIKEVVKVLCDMTYWQHKHYQQLCNIYGDSLIVDGDSTFSHAENAKMHLVRIILDVCEIDNQIEVEARILTLLNKLEACILKEEVERITNEVIEFVISNLSYNQEQ